MPFAPSFSAGTSNANAGQFSPLTLTFNREDREQDLAAIQVKTPPGLLGTLTGVPLCGEPQADLGTCSEASRIGTMTVAAGPGGHPFYEKGSLYLTGPYRGAPFGLIDRRADDRGPVQPRQRRRPRADRGGPEHGGVDGHQRPAAADPRRHPAAVAYRERDGRPARVHLQPDQLRAAAHRQGRSPARRAPSRTSPRRSRSPAARAWTSARSSASTPRGTPRARTVRAWTSSSPTPTGRSRTSPMSRSNSPSSSPRG